MQKYANIKLRGIGADGKRKSYALSDFQGEKVVVYFYPKDETSYCTKEACDFRDNQSRFGKNMRIVGVSPDSVDSHAHFHKKEGLNFVLLSDPDRELAKAFNVPDSMGFVSRTTFLLDEKGNIVKEWQNVKVDGHIEEVMNSAN